MQSRLITICSVYGQRAQADLSITRNKVAGLFGNGDIESGGYNTLQEIAPTVEGSAGGFGWMQWTGPRRRRYLAWADALGLDPSADETNYRYMVRELLTDEQSALRALRACADDPATAATVVCTKYLRPGIPHLDKRIASAKRAATFLEGNLGATNASAAGQAGLSAVAQALGQSVQHGIAAGPAATVRTVGIAEQAPLRTETGHWPEQFLSEFEIKAIQQRFLDLGYHVVGFVDGKWGARTSAAASALQRASGLAIDGHYGPETRAALADDASKAIVATERATTKLRDLLKIGNPTATAGRGITLASGFSILAGVGTLGSALATGWSTELPWPLSMLTAVLPPWVGIALIVVLNVYNALKATGLMGSAVERVRQGIDNTGAPAAVGQNPQGLPALPFGLDKLIPR